MWTTTYSTKGDHEAASLPADVNLFSSEVSDIIGKFAPHCQPILKRTTVQEPAPKGFVNVWFAMATKALGDEHEVGESKHSFAKMPFQKIWTLHLKQAVHKWKAKARPLNASSGSYRFRKVVMPFKHRAHTSLIQTCLNPISRNGLEWFTNWKKFLTFPYLFWLSNSCKDWIKVVFFAFMFIKIPCRRQISSSTKWSSKKFI